MTTRHLRLSPRIRRRLGTGAVAASAAVATVAASAVAVAGFPDPPNEKGSTARPYQPGAQERLHMSVPFLQERFDLANVPAVVTLVAPPGWTDLRCGRARVVSPADNRTEVVGATCTVEPGARSITWDSLVLAVGANPDSRMEVSFLARTPRPAATTSYGARGSALGGFRVSAEYSLGGGSRRWVAPNETRFANGVVSTSLVRTVAGTGAVSTPAPTPTRAPSPSATPSPQPTPSSTPTPTPSPSPSPSPEPTPDPTPEPTPTTDPTPDPTPTPSPEQSPSPQATPFPDPTPEPTPTPDPTPDPTPTPSPTPEPTPEPTPTPEATPSPEPTSSPDPTTTPEPTPTPEPAPSPDPGIGPAPIVINLPDNLCPTPTSGTEGADDDIVTLTQESIAEQFPVVTCVIAIVAEPDGTVTITVTHQVGPPAGLDPGSGTPSGPGAPVVQPVSVSTVRDAADGDQPATLTVTTLT